MSILSIQANFDNWIYVHPYQSGQCWIVDPSDAVPVMQLIDRKKLTATHIMITHHHGDHIAGIASLKKTYGCQVISPDKKRIPDTDILVSDRDTLVLGDWTITVLATPGHTTSTTCYYCTHLKEPPVLYSGDTLFSYGCGRLFEGSAETMYRSLKKLAALPEDTCVYPGHNYTEENVRFALSVEPNKEELKQLLACVQKQKDFMPTTLRQEKQYNPFLRVDRLVIQRSSDKAAPAAVFAELRRLKDNF
jgi:hydroxyacylglutathione hydrolase